MEIIGLQYRIQQLELEKNYYKILSLIEVIETPSIIVLPIYPITGKVNRHYFDLGEETNNYYQELSKKYINHKILWAEHKEIYVAYKGQITQFEYKYEDEDIIATFYSDPENTHKTQILFKDSYSFVDEEDKVFNNLTYIISSYGLINESKNVHINVGSSYISENNQITHKLPLFKTDYLSQRSELSNVKLTAINLLTKIIKYYDEEVFNSKINWIIGLSGGLDSSVSLALLERALGPQRLIAVSMPSEYNREQSKNNARSMAKTLNVSFYEIPIQSLSELTVDQISMIDVDVSSGLAYENIQARLRGHILMSLASSKSGVIINNGNKVETTLGYATMYGDAIGALSLLADLSKLEVGKIAQEINREKGEEIIPNNLIPRVYDDRIEWDFAPSAELSEDQWDPMKWGYHDEVIEYLFINPVESLMVEYHKNKCSDLPCGRYIQFYGLEEPEVFIEDLEWLLKQMNAASFKRIQLPPIASIKENSYGNRFHEYQHRLIYTGEYNRLKRKILENK